MRKLLVAVIVVALLLGIYGFIHHRTFASFFRTNGITSGGPLAQPVPAAAFSLRDLNGRQLSLSDYRGKVVLLDFWATWCDPCREEIPHFVEFQNKYRDPGLQIIGVSMDDGPQPVREFYEQFKMNYPVALGTAKMAEAYGGILGIPVTFLIDRDGRIAAKYIGQVEMPVLEREIETLLQRN